MNKSHDHSFKTTNTMISKILIKTAQLSCHTLPSCCNS